MGVVGTAQANSLDAPQHKLKNKKKKNKLATLSTIYGTSDHCHARPLHKPFGPTKAKWANSVTFGFMEDRYIWNCQIIAGRLQNYKFLHAPSSTWTLGHGKGSATIQCVIPLLAEARKPGPEATMVTI